MKKFVKSLLVMAVAIFIIPVMFLVGCGVSFTPEKEISLSNKPTVGSAEYINVGKVQGDSIDTISVGSLNFKKGYKCKLNSTETTAEAFKVEDGSLQILSTVLFCEGYKGKIGIDSDWFTINYSRKITSKSIDNCSCADEKVTINKNSNSQYTITFTEADDAGKQIALKLTTEDTSAIMRIMVGSKLYMYQNCSLNGGTLTLQSGFFKGIGANSIDIKVYTENEIFSVKLNAKYAK